MRVFVVSALLIGLVGLHSSDSSFLGDRLGDRFGLKEGNNNNNNVLRKSKGCTVLCSLKINFKNKNNQGHPQTCYQLPGKNNATVSECVFNCLKLKGEKLENATECACQNGACIAVAPASQSSTTTNNIVTTETTEIDEENSSSSSSTSSSPAPSSTSTPVSTTIPTTRPQP